MSLAGRWAGTPLCRVTELYRPPTEHPVADDWDIGRFTRLAATVAAYHVATAGTGEPLTMGWCRPHPQGTVTVLASADALTATMTTALGVDRPLSFPPGARGSPLPPGAGADLLRTLPSWTRISGVADGLLIDATPPAEPTDRRPSLEDCLLATWHAPFGWLLLAEPVPPAEVAAEATRVAGQERDARVRTSSPEYAVRADRLDSRHRELRAAQSTGLWRVHLLAGGTEPTTAIAVAALLCASLDLRHLAYALTPGHTVAGLDATLTSATGSGDDPRSPFLAGSPLVAALAPVPSREIPGVRLALRPGFDVTPEPAGDGDGIDLGRVLDRDRLPAGTMSLPTDSLNRHTFVCGATGAGKSQTVRHLLTQASRAGLPWLAVEPAKAEYRRMAARLAPLGRDVVVIRPGDPDAVPVGLNPLEPEPGFPLQTHLDLVRALFTAAFQADEPFPQVLAAALTRCYQELGWDLTLSTSRNPATRPRYPTLSDLQRTAEIVVTEIGYGQEIADNVRGFVKVRLASLRLGTTGRFFDGAQPLDFALLRQRNVVLEIEDVGDDRDKAFVMGAVLMRLVEHLRVAERTGTLTPGLGHLTVIEEAHRLLRRAETPGPAAHAVEMFAALLAEVRAYGEGLIVAEQIPAKLVPDVIKNTAVKIVHRLPARDDRDTVGATMNLTDEQSRYLVTLPPGTAAVFTDGMDYPILAEIPAGMHTEQQQHPTVSPAVLAAGRPAGCGPRCHQHACTLRTMTAARHLLDDDPRLTVWAELTVLAHLIGMPAPTPADDLAAALSATDTQLRECLIRQAVDISVAIRSTALATSHSPAALTDHIAAELRAQLAGTTACPTEPGAWLAPCFRWNTVRLALTDLHRADPDAGRHPDSDDWERRHRRAISGATCKAQLDNVQRWCVELLRNTDTVDGVLYGTGTPTPLETAIGTSRSDTSWHAAVAAAIETFQFQRHWSLAFLAPASGRDAS